jgi:uncharacterized membrane protein YphA (DoxX/SURF4 family)
MAIKHIGNVSSLYLRAALGLSLLSAVADRFGLWGAPGRQNVAWGDFGHFVTYTATLNWFAPAGLIPVLAWGATIAETTLGIGLLIGIWTRIVALLSGTLLMVFALAMAFALGIKAPLDFSVFSASAGAFLLAAQSDYPFSLDSWRRSRFRR